MLLEFEKDADELYQDLVKTVKELDINGRFIGDRTKWSIDLPDYFSKKGNHSLAVKAT